MPEQGSEKRQSQKGGERFDLVVVGAGPGGYVAAIRAAQLGLRTALVERRSTLGGTCLNIGCIPSKALLDSSEQYAKALTGLADHGVKVGDVELDLATMMKRKDRVVRQLTRGVASLTKANGVVVYAGAGRVLGAGRVAVGASGDASDPGTGGGNETVLESDYGVLAPGSNAIELPVAPFDGTKVVSSTEALSFDAVPERMIVIGGGAIGLEMASVWARLGAEVTVLERLPTLIPGWDDELAAGLRKELERQGLAVHCGVNVTECRAEGARATVRAEQSEGSALELEVDRVLVAVGRRPYTVGLGLEECGVELDDGGRISIDDDFRTAVEGVYAIGDAVRGAMLAHKAQEEGVAVAELIAGRAGHVNYDVVPSVVYTWPEVAAVGRSEAELTRDGVPFRSGTFPFSANGRALGMGDSAGFVKLLAHEDTDRLLGAHVIGPWASDLIGECAAAMELGGSAEDLARTVHAHPTLSEGVKEAALGVDGRMIHGL